MSPENAIEPQDSRFDDGTAWQPPAERMPDDGGGPLWRLTLAAALAVVALAAAGSLLA